MGQRIGFDLDPIDDDASDSEDEGTNGKAEDDKKEDDAPVHEADAVDFEVLLMRKFATRWAKKAGVKSVVCDPLRESEALVDWTRTIAPVLEGRIKMVKQAA